MAWTALEVGGRSRPCGLLDDLDDHARSSPPLRRSSSSILLIVSALLFCILRLLPVDPAAMSLPPNATLAEIEAKRHEMGLDQPLSAQYLIWLGAGAAWRLRHLDPFPPRRRAA